MKRPFWNVTNCRTLPWCGILPHKGIPTFYGRKPMKDRIRCRLTFRLCRSHKLSHPANKTPPMKGHEGRSSISRLATSAYPISPRYFLALLEAGVTRIRCLFALHMLFLEFAALLFAILADIHNHLCHLDQMRRVVAGKLLDRLTRGNHLVDAHGAYGHSLVLALAPQMDAMAEAG